MSSEVAPPGGRVRRAADAERVETAGDPVTVCELLGPTTGFAPLAQRLLECAPGRGGPCDPGTAEEVLFVLAGHGVLHTGGSAHGLDPECGAYIAPDETYELENPGREPLRLLAVRIPEPLPAAAAAGEQAIVRRVADQEAEAATTDRQFRVIADPATGLRSATHFVGYIPTARAPDHFHTYDEVIYVLEGKGVMRMEGQETPLSAGSCIQLPARTVHCLENTGAETMRIVAVFRPGGSPAEAYYPDGTPAYAPEERSAEATQMNNAGGGDRP